MAPTGRKVIVLDTETTGLPERGPGFGKIYAPWDFGKYRGARLIQLAYAVYELAADGTAVTAVREVNKYVIPSDFTISAESTAIHGITGEFAAANGQSAIRVLKELETELEDVVMIIGHNISFDRAVLQSEAWRNSMTELAMMLDQIPCGCTMRAGIRFMGGEEKKWPKLIALHSELFGVSFDGAHNAMEDVRATAKCWLRLRSEGYML